jgi:hypothetical protein
LIFPSVTEGIVFVSNSKIQEEFIGDELEYTPPPQKNILPNKRDSPTFSPFSRKFREYQTTNFRYQRNPEEENVYKIQRSQPIPIPTQKHTNLNPYINPFRAEL